MNTETIETEEVNQNAAIAKTGPQSAPIKFDVTKNAIERMKTHAGTLTIAGPDDKAGYEAVFNYRQTVKKQRIAVENKAKDLKAPHTAYNRKVDASRNEIVESLEEIEDGLAKQEKDYKDERERIATEKAAVIRERYHKRALALKDMGYTFDDVAEAYVLADLYINKDDIRDLTDEEYAATFRLAQIKAETEQARLAEEQRVIEENNRIAAEAQKAEQERLAEERRQMELEQLELKRQQDELAADQKRLQDEKDSLTLKERTARLVELGAKVTTTGIQVQGAFTSYTNAKLIAMSEEDFTIEIDVIIHDQQEKEQARLDALAADEARKTRLAPDKETINKAMIQIKKVDKLPQCTEHETGTFVMGFYNDLISFVQKYQDELVAL